jgi:hypothetical protein
MRSGTRQIPDHPMYHKQNYDTDGVFAPIILFSYVSYEYETNLNSRESPAHKEAKSIRHQGSQFDDAFTPLDRFLSN